MKFSLLIIITLLCVYTTWVQKTAREVISKTALREEDLAARLACSEESRRIAESSLAAALSDSKNLILRQTAPAPSRAE